MHKVGFIASMMVPVHDVDGPCTVGTATWAGPSAITSIFCPSWGQAFSIRPPGLRRDCNAGLDIYSLSPIYSAYKALQPFLA